MKRAIVSVGVLIIAAFVPVRADAALRVEFFHEPGCPECRRVETIVLPRLETYFPGACTLVWRNTEADTNYLALVAYQEALGSLDNASAIVVLDGRRLLAGWDEIDSELVPAVAALLDSRGAHAVGLQPAAEPVLERRLEGFTLAGVALAGLTDGINPCAIGTLVFFLSLLAVLKTGSRRLLAVGLVFCAASFLTYTAIGLGLLRVLHAFSGFHALRRGFDLALSVMLVVLAWLSFRDAARYRRSRRAEAVLLQLPDTVKARIRRVVHRGLEGRRIWTGAFTAGVFVTALESVCTGQVYVPTLVFMLKRGASPWRAFGYLMAYNLMFIVPILAALVLTVRGLRTMQLVEWSRRNVVSAKILMGLFFLVMALVIALL
jgi:hypothetical protein